MRFIVFALGLTIAIVAASATPLAADLPMSAAFRACAAKAHATYPRLHCYSIEAQARNDALNSAYAAALAAKSDPRTKDYLAKSQTAWSDYLDAWCEATVSRSGSGARFGLFDCRLRETTRRTKELISLLWRIDRRSA
jgi:uncharacterized protein YecT (DUF1311 family)